LSFLIPVICAFVWAWYLKKIKSRSRK
jgi:hypothetical protein